jgi:hypothetical protein
LRIYYSIYLNNFLINASFEIVFTYLSLYCMTLGVLRKSVNSITLAKSDIKQSGSGIDRHMDDFYIISSTCPFDAYTRDITVLHMHDFEKIYKYDSHKNNVIKLVYKKFCRYIFAHIYQRDTPDRGPNCI